MNKVEVNLKKHLQNRNKYHFKMNKVDKKSNKDHLNKEEDH